MHRIDRAWGGAINYPRPKLQCNVLPPQHELPEEEVQALLTSFWRHSEPCPDARRDQAPTLSRYAQHRLDEDHAARRRFLPDDAILFENVGSCSGYATPASTSHHSVASEPGCGARAAGQDHERPHGQSATMGRVMSGLKALVLCCLGTQPANCDLAHNAVCQARHTGRHAASQQRCWQRGAEHARGARVSAGA